jgi:hypothetical protein
LYKKKKIMATRSRIAIENQDGTVTSIYCHWDGHVETNGRILDEAFNTANKLNALIALGNISSLGRSIEDTKAYARDLGEDLNQTTYEGVEDLFESGFNSGEEYVYCFIKDGRWLVNEYGSNNVAVLEEALEEIEA